MKEEEDGIQKKKRAYSPSVWISGAAGKRLGKHS